MILDAELQLSSSQALTATAVSTNTIDLGTDRSIGNGEPLGILFTVEVAADQTTGDEDYAFQAIYSSAADLSAGLELVGQRTFESGTPTAPAQDADLLVAGFQFVIPIPPTRLSESDRYFGVRYLLAGTTPTITVSADVVPLSMIDSNIVTYADGFTIT